MACHVFAPESLCHGIGSHITINCEFIKRLPFESLCFGAQKCFLLNFRPIFFDLVNQLFVVNLCDLRNRLFSKPRSNTDNPFKIVFLVPGGIRLVFAAVKITAKASRRGQASLGVRDVFLCYLCKALVCVTVFLINLFLFAFFKFNGGGHSGSSA